MPVQTGISFMIIVNSLLWKMEFLRLKHRGRLPQGMAKQGGKPVLTGVENFLGNYRDGGPFQKIWRGSKM